MSTAVALQVLTDVEEPRLLDEPEWQEWAVESAPGIWGRSAVMRAGKWASIGGLLALGGLWSRLTPFEVVARCIVDAGAIIVMAGFLMERRYALVAISGSLAVLYNPLAPVFNLSGGWQRAALVGCATPFLASVIWRDMRTDRSA